ncbi:chorismate synthase [Acidobacteria bacterium AH-259-G07]|nr:chorismate synthase [Acidobacteria bacterium AH-259-G07]
MLRFLTSGESHGKGLLSTIEAFPAKVPVDVSFINAELKRRMSGYGRGARMKIESDQIDIFAGVRHGYTLGSPIGFIIHNRDWVNWSDIMSSEPNPEAAEKRRVTRPRPGHADLVGGLKYQFDDMRNVLERSSARETTSRVAIGAFCKLLLRELGIQVYSHIVSIKDVRISAEQLEKVSFDLVPQIESSDMRCSDVSLDEAMKKAVDQAIEKGETIGGTFEVRAVGVPAGLGSYVHWDRKLDGRLAQAVMSINAIKAVEVGRGLELDPYGSEFHDEIFYNTETREFYRKTNRAGGIEGGTSNGQEIVVRGVVKPIPTLRRPLMSVDVATKEPFKAQYERSDTCIVPAAGVIGEAMVAIVLAQAVQEKFGGDTLQEIQSNLQSYCRALKEM